MKDSELQFDRSCHVLYSKDKQKKWLFGTVGMAVIAMVLAAMMTAFIH